MVEEKKRMKHHLVTTTNIWTRLKIQRLTLEAETGKEISLHDFIEKLVLIGIESIENERKQRE